MRSQHCTYMEIRDNFRTIDFFEMAARLHAAIRCGSLPEQGRYECLGIAGHINTIGIEHLRIANDTVLQLNREQDQNK